MTQDERWPKYNPQNIHEHIHAIGVLSFNFNNIENDLLSLLTFYDDAPDKVVAFLFEKVSTETRLEWLLRLIEARKLTPPHLRDCIHAFCKAYKICADNRNLIMHSRIIAYLTSDDAILLSKRVRKHGELTHHDVSLEVIRRVADEVHFWNEFGHHVLLYVLRKQRFRQKRYKRPGVKPVGPTTLPKISLPPEALAKQSQS